MSQNDSLTQLTVRLDDSLAQAVKELASTEGISLNKAAVRLLRRGAGLEAPRKKVGNSLDKYFGTWTQEEYAEFERATADFNVIDEEMWS